MAVERLQKILSNAGAASRRQAEELILAGRVAVNGVAQTTLGGRADPEVDEVTVDGVPVLRGRYRYFALNKPAGVVTTASDEQGRATVLDLVPIGDIQLHPVGRLDLDSEGLLLLTNDGHLTNLLTHPRYEVEKEYLVALDAPVARAGLQRLVRGVESEGERLRALSAAPAMPPPAAPGEELPAAGAWLVLTLGEGKNREVRRMMASLGREVRLLRRIGIGPLRLGGLGPGAFRELLPGEVEQLYGSATTARARGDSAPRGRERPARDAQRQGGAAPGGAGGPAQSVGKRAARGPRARKRE